MKNARERNRKSECGCVEQGRSTSIRDTKRMTTLLRTPEAFGERKKEAFLSYWKVIRNCLLVLWNNWRKPRSFWENSDSQLSNTCCALLIIPTLRWKATLLLSLTLRSGNSWLLDINQKFCGTSFPFSSQTARTFPTCRNMTVNELNDEPPPSLLLTHPSLSTSDDLLKDFW